MNRCNTAVVLLFVTSLRQPSSAAATKPVYPEIKKDATAVDDYFGVKVPNPFKWLTTANETEILTFIKNQNLTTDNYLSQLPAADRKIIQENIVYNGRPLNNFHPPIKAGEFLFFRDEHDTQLLVQRGLNGNSSLLLSSRNGTNQTWDWDTVIAVPTADGKTIAYCIDSFLHGDICTVKIKSLATGKNLPDTLANVVAIIIGHYLHHRRDVLSWSWNTDGTGLYYLSNSSTPTAVPKSERKGNKTQNTFLLYHAIGTKQVDDILLAEFPNDRIYSLKISDDGHYLIVVFELEKNEFFILRQLEVGLKTYILELCATEKPPCNPSSKTKKPKIYTLVAPEFNALHFLGNVGSQMYFLNVNNISRVEIVHFELSHSKQKDWKTVGIWPSGSDLFISDTKLVNSQFLFTTTHKENVDAVIMYNIKTKVNKELPLVPGRLLALRLSGNEITYSVLCPVTQEAEMYLMDVTNDPIESKRIRQPGTEADSFIDKLVYEDKEYKSNGIGVPMVLVYSKDLKKDGTAPMLLVLQSASRPVDYARPHHRSLINLYIPFMRIFNGIVAFVGVHTEGMVPKADTVTSAVNSVEFMVAEKYTSKARLIVAPGAADMISVVGILINQRPELFGAALLHDADTYINSLPDMFLLLRMQPTYFDFSPRFKSKNQTLELLPTSPIHNIKAPKDKKVEYPAVLLIGGYEWKEAMSYIAQLQSEIGIGAKQVKPLLGKFSKIRREANYSEQTANTLTFLALALDLNIKK